MIYKIPNTNHTLQIFSHDYLTIPFSIDIGFKFQYSISISFLFWAISIDELPF